MSDATITRVGDVMTPSPHVIDGLASVRDAIEIMRERNVNSLIIDKRHEDDEYGMVSVHDIAEQVIAIDRSVERTSVYEIMSKPVLSVHKQMDVKYAIRLLTRFKLSRALVVEHGNMVGIVTLRDMAVRYVDVREPGGT
jgi:signal-transduction protein with cAMP-binding, CBS, and nucleotidyltransferase domain